MVEAAAWAIFNLEAKDSVVEAEDLADLEVAVLVVEALAEVGN